MLPELLQTARSGPPTHGRQSKIATVKRGLDSDARLKERPLNCLESEAVSNALGIPGVLVDAGQMFRVKKEHK